MKQRLAQVQTNVILKDIENCKSKFFNGKTYMTTVIIDFICI